MDNSWQSQSLGALIVSRLKRWWNAPLHYPWPDELNEEVCGPDSARLCHRCFAAQEHLGWFCPECGTATGPYNNILPFIYIFSSGEVFRSGVTCNKKPAAYVTAGYLFLSVFEYMLFFPFYWYRFFRNRAKQRLMCDAEDEADGGEQVADSHDP